MNLRICLCKIIALIAFLHPAASVLGDSRLVIAENGESKYDIIVSVKPTKQEMMAAKDLKHYLELITRGKFSLINENERKSKDHGIYVGRTTAFMREYANIDLKKLGNDGIVLKTDLSGNIYLNGGPMRGVFYAASTFLEDFCGVRWWTKTEEYVPRKPTLAVVSPDEMYSPKLFYREVGYHNPGTVFSARLKINGHFEHIPPEYGGHYRILGWCHTFYRLLPPKTYFAKHPEWYSLVRGKRRPSHAQLCLTNPEMRKEMTRRALEWIRKNPDAGIISISQNDCGGFCECEKCREMRKLEGSDSGPLIHFINAVADAVSRKYPGVLVETLAYNKTQFPPLHVKPADNVIIRLCSIKALVDRPLTDPVNAPFKKDLKNWSDLSSKLFVWDYVANFSNFLAPHPNLYNFESNIRFFVRNNVVGVFEQGNGMSQTGDFDELKRWVLAHLLWNPSYSENELIEEFLKGYYGPADQYLLSYLRLVNKSAREKNVGVNCYNIKFVFMGLPEMNRATELFDKAENAVADNKIFLSRVRHSRLSLDHLWLIRYWWLKQRSTATGSRFLGPGNPSAACEEFIRACHAVKAKYAESAGNAAHETYLRDLCADRPLASRPAEVKGGTDWLDLQDNMFLNAFHSPNKIVDDPLASDGKALWVPGRVHNWVFRLPISEAASIYTKPVHCYISVRCESSADTGNAYSVGIYDDNSRRGVVNKNVSLKNLTNNKYHTCDLGIHTLTPSMYLWFVGPGDQTRVKSIFIDRVFVVNDR